MNQLETACAQGNQAEAESILAAHPELVAELANVDESDDVDETSEVADADGGEGEGDAGRLPGGAGGEGDRPRTRVARTFNPSEHLAEGMTVLCGGGRGEDSEVDAHGRRMESGLSLVCGGKATRYATDVATAGAVVGNYEEGEGSGERSGTGGGSNPHDPVGVGSLVDPTANLAALGYGIVETRGPMGNFAVVHKDTGRLYGMYDARLPEDARPGVRSWMAVGVEIRTRAMAGASFSGEYYNSRGIC